MKAYVVSKYGNCDDGGTIVGVWLDKEQCESDVEKLNEPRKKELLLHEECVKCRDFDAHREDEVFLLKDSCPHANIKTDRNGEYCENDMENYYSMKSDSYHIEEIEVVEKPNKADDKLAKEQTDALNNILSILKKSKANEVERDKLLHDAEVMCLKGNANCKPESPKRLLYSVAANTIHKDRNFLLSKIDAETMTGICVCGTVTDIIDGDFYCKYCGQKLSATYGWTIENYYNEEHRYTKEDTRCD